MAKMETPAESLRADASRAVLDGRAKLGLPPADLFDAGTGYGKPGAGGLPRAGSALSHDEYLHQGPGPARARDRRGIDGRDIDQRNIDQRSVEELPFVDEEDVIEEEPLVDDSRSGRANFGSPRDFFGAGRGGVASRLPMANLDPPSGARLDLTPSPVPRVALAPATGSVDISLVPGPNATGSRNWPTLAAHHLFGPARQRRPAAAVTLPPPGELPRDVQKASREPLAQRRFAKDVRSSKREIVLGLTIGLGLSMLLAAVGQAYLEEDPIAEAAPSELESLTLSARPEAMSPEATPSEAMPPEARPPEARPGPEGAGSVAVGAVVNPSMAAQPAQAGVNAAAPGAANTDPSLEAPSLAGASADVAPAVGGSFGNGGVSRSDVATSGGIDQRAFAIGEHTSRRSTQDRARRGARGNAAARKGPSMLSEEPPTFEAGKSFEAPPADNRSPLSPAESAGLGLDLPL